MKFSIDVPDRIITVTALVLAGAVLYLFRKERTDSKPPINKEAWPTTVKMKPYELDKKPISPHDKEMEERDQKAKDLSSFSKLKNLWGSTEHTGKMSVTRSSGGSNQTIEVNLQVNGEVCKKAVVESTHNGINFYVRPEQLGATGSQVSFGWKLNVAPREFDTSVRLVTVQNSTTAGKRTRKNTAIVSPISTHWLKEFILLNKDFVITQFTIEQLQRNQRQLQLGLPILNPDLTADLISATCDNKVATIEFDAHIYEGSYQVSREEAATLYTKAQRLLTLIKLPSHQKAMITQSSKQLVENFSMEKLADFIKQSAQNDREHNSPSYFRFLADELFIWYDSTLKQVIECLRNINDWEISEIETKASPSNTQFAVEQQRKFKEELARVLTIWQGVNISSGTTDKERKSEKRMRGVKSCVIQQINNFQEQLESQVTYDELEQIVNTYNETVACTRIPNPGESSSQFRSLRANRTSSTNRYTLAPKHSELMPMPEQQLPGARLTAKQQQHSDLRETTPAEAKLCDQAWGSCR